MKTLKTSAVLLAVAAMAASAAAQTVTYQTDARDPNHAGGQLTISGATLFEAFFADGASTYDFIDVNGNQTTSDPNVVVGIKNYRTWYVPDPLNPSDPNGYVATNEQLAATWTGNNISTWWTVQYRGVGSGNGLAEFVNWNTSATLPNEVAVPADPGLLNRFEYTSAGQSGVSPIPADSVDIAVMDVPTSWFTVKGDSSTAAWNNGPLDAGYGANDAVSIDGQGNTLKSLGGLNINTASPDANTVFDHEIAWVPVAYMANAGVDRGQIEVSELQWLFTTGRLSNGENLMACTRDSGSGTRNAAMNSLGIDPSWGVGENMGVKNEDKPNDRLGELFQPTNRSSSSRMEATVENHRLAVGYTGWGGNSKAADHAAGEDFELLALLADTHPDYDPADPNWTYVSPNIDNILDNADPRNGWQYGGSETMATLGNPEETDPNSAAFMDTVGNTSDWSALQNADAAQRQLIADYINNIKSSIADFQLDASDPTLPERTHLGGPADYLARNFTLTGGVDALPTAADPTNFVANSVNSDLQEYMRYQNIWGDEAYNAADAGHVPTRLALDPNGPAYSDGQFGAYRYYHEIGGTAYEYTISGGSDLNSRNRVAGDFNNDGDRDITDIAQLIAAVQAPADFEKAVNHGGDQGDLLGDYAIAEILGDFTGDGNFDADDVRYFADGLAVDPNTGYVERTDAFVAVDVAFGGNFFGTEIITLDPNVAPSAIKTAYAYGDSAGDLCGADRIAAGNYLPAADGKIDFNDLFYMIDQAKGDYDLTVMEDVLAGANYSADLTGDRLVNDDDVLVLLNILGTRMGDANLDGKTDDADYTLWADNYGAAGDWTSGDFNGDGFIDDADYTVWADNYGAVATVTPEPASLCLLGLGAAALIRRRR